MSDRTERLSTEMDGRSSSVMRVKVAMFFKALSGSSKGRCLESALLLTAFVLKSTIRWGNLPDREKAEQVAFGQ